MESSKEKIEAQLCAYVEGELDDAERAEIEQHLAANPQHQALIAELRAASGLLRDLPRIGAPIDLNESLCGQIERGALLDPSDDPGTPGLRVNRWPQFTAVAAVLILAVGLGLVIYYVLPPSGGHSRTQLAVDDRSKQAEPSIELSRDQDVDAFVRNRTKQREG
jgi:anti-sigma factor RsiW